MVNRTFGGTTLAITRLTVSRIPYPVSRIPYPLARHHESGLKVRVKGIRIRGSDGGIGWGDDLAKRWNKDGLLSDKGLRAVLDVER